MKIKRVLATNNAIAIIEQLKETYGELVFHQSGGCCDGSTPMCFSKGELFLNETDVCIGQIHGCYFYIPKDLFNYWKPYQLLIDSAKGRSSGFSLEQSLGVRFITKSKLLSKAEELQLVPLTGVT